MYAVLFHFIIFECIFMHVQFCITYSSPSFVDAHPEFKAWNVSSLTAFDNLVIVIPQFVSVCQSQHCRCVVSHVRIIALVVNAANQFVICVFET